MMAHSTEIVEQMRRIWTPGLFWSKASNEYMLIKFKSFVEISEIEKLKAVRLVFYKKMGAKSSPI